METPAPSLGWHWLEKSIPTDLSLVVGVRMHGHWILMLRRTLALGYMQQESRAGVLDLCLVKHDRRQFLPTALEIRQET